YPRLDGIVEEVERWGKWIIDELKRDPLLKELYEEDVAVYIGSWEFNCPNCKKWTPIVGNWWLARVKGEEGYERLSFFRYNVSNGSVEVVDLGNRSSLAEVDGRSIKLGNEALIVPEPNVDGRRNTALCLHCGMEIKKSVESGDEWYVKWALKKFNEGDERFARQRLLVKVKISKGDLSFHPCDAEDQKRLERAKEEVKKLIEAEDPDLPVDLFAPYQMGTAGTFKITLWGFDRFYKLFNPRQLITLVKLVKLIREVGKKVEEEKLREGLSKEDAFKFAEAVTAYLAISLCKYINYNSITTRWHPVMSIVGETLSVRGIAMMWNWCDVNYNAPLTGSLSRNIERLKDSLKYLTSAISNSNSSNIFLDDATILSKINEKFDLIITDPPYRDDVQYTELSDFYYVWLKRALSDVEGNRLKPRFLPESFFKKIGAKYKEIETQWQEFAKREVSYNEGRYENEGLDALERYKKLLISSFKAMRERLNEDGVIGIYFAHSSFEAWAELIETLISAGLRMTFAFPLATESKDRVTGRGKLTMDTSLFIICRPSSGGEVMLNNLRSEIEKNARRVAEHLSAKDLPGRDTLIGTMISAIVPVTNYSRILTSSGEISIKEILEKVVYPIVGKVLAETYGEKAKIGDQYREIRDPHALFYLIAKISFGGGKTTKPFTSDDVITLCRASGLDRDLAKLLVSDVKGEEEELGGGSKVANPKAVKLLEITDTNPEKIKAFLAKKKLPLTEPKPRNAVDAYHYLLYFASQFSNERIKHEYREMIEKFEFAEDAFKLAKIISKMKNGAEKDLSLRLLRAVEGLS
ncbi:MAG: hypothetical protein NZ879_06675, partial [Archaeoglobaceae archaeon]|nr:hypothetical protein [Archaeoglobaceae archaeon]MDW8118650.1 hypothetical protein [Archaeoglobaceae archaeon]